MKYLFLLIRNGYDVTFVHHYFTRSITMKVEKTPHYVKMVDAGRKELVDGSWEVIFATYLLKICDELQLREEP